MVHLVGYIDSCITMHGVMNVKPMLHSAYSYNYLINKQLH